MKMKEIFDLSNSPFQGDRTVELRRIPAGARIQRATAIVTPTAAGGTAPFAETIKFTGAVGKFVGTDISGGTKTTISQQWVEVDFHGRQTLSRVKGAITFDPNPTNTDNNATLQVDLGGAYAEVNSKGALKSPNDQPFRLSTQLSDGSFALPAMAVAKFKLTAASGPDVSEVVVRSVPTNVSMRFGETPVFWTRVGELAQVEITPDFTASLQGFLADAKIENGFYVVPLVLHSDTIARLKVELEVEFLVEQSALPAGLGEVTLPYDFDGLPKTTPELLTITAPAGSRIVPQGSRARVVGSFADTRIVYNPIETVSPEGFVSTVKPAGKVTISPEDSFAQPISLSADIAATAIDLFLEIKQTVRLQLDLREDLDGKPGETSLLPKAVEIELSGPVGLEQSKGEQDRQRWVSVPLPIEFQFKAADKQKRYWLTLQSLVGEADWSVATALPSSATIETLSLQRLSLRAADAALAWREATVSGVANPLTAFFRLRHLPKRFTMPVALQVGTGDSPVRVDLSRYQDQGRVDFALDFEQVEQARQKFLTNAAPMCAEVEHLANGDFEKWDKLNSDVGTPQVLLTLSSDNPVLTSDGAQILHIKQGEGSSLSINDSLCGSSIQQISLGAKYTRITSNPAIPRVYLAGKRLKMLDTSLRQELGQEVEITGDGVIESVDALIVDGKGGRLYLAVTRKNSNQQIDRSLEVVDLAKWEEGITSNQSINYDNILLAHASIPQSSSSTLSAVVDMAVDPNKELIYILISNGNQQGSVKVFSAVTLQDKEDSFTDIGINPCAMSLSSDGKLAVVANKGSASVSLIDIDNKTVTSIQLSNLFPTDVVISPNNKKIYFTAQSSISGSNVSHSVISYIDLTQQPMKPVELIKMLVSITKLLLSPQGERLFMIGSVILSSGSSSIALPKSYLLYTVSIGRFRPLEWNLTSGQVNPYELPPPFHRAAILSGFSQSGDLTMGALSQLTPVVGSCVYDFNFWALANDVGALAEIFWMNGTCGLLQTDQLPVNARARKPEISASFFSAHDGNSANSNATISIPKSLLHHKRLVAPKEAEQVEIRFSTPAGVCLAIDNVSLKGTTESIANEDFQQLSSEGELGGWKATPGLIVSKMTGGEIGLSNSGRNVEDLAQTVNVKGDRSFNLEFEGSAAKSDKLPSLEIEWMKPDGSIAGEKAKVELRPDSGGAVTASGQSPKNATQAEIRFVLPPGSSLTVKKVSLRFPVMVSVPITFVAQAPGELAINDLQISFEDGDPLPPRIPEHGLCPPTPPDGRPGEGKSDCAFCCCCGAEKQMVETQSAVTDSGRPANLGNCVDCGTEMTTFSGAVSPGAPALSRLRAAIRQPVVIHAETVRTATAGGGQLEVAGETVKTDRKTLKARKARPATGRNTPLVTIKGIAEKRASELKKIGINSVEDLAAASPKTINKLKGISPAVAKKLIAAAKELIKPH